MMNKRALTWQYMILAILSILLIIFGILYYTDIGSQIIFLIDEFFKSIFR